MPANESSVMIYIIGRFHSKVLYQKWAFSTNTGTDYS